MMSTLAEKERTLKENENDTLINIDNKVKKTVIIDEDSIHYNQRKLGNTFLFYFKNGNPIIVIGPHWPFFICLLSIILFILILFFVFLWNKVDRYVLCFGIVIAVIQIFSYIYTAIINPGIPSKDYINQSQADESKNLRLCKQCKLWINTEAKTFHCYECNVCIEGNNYIIINLGYDHHCPWTSKCIGRGNFNSFIIFIAFTMTLFGFFVFSMSLIKQ